MDSIKAAILCGGQGSRLRPLTYYFQKTMLPIGRRQKPMLEYVLKYIGSSGIKDATLLVGYKAEQIINYFGEGSSVGMKISYSRDSPKLEGNGGALFNAFSKGLFGGYEDVLVYYSDILTTLDLKKMIEEHRNHKNLATLAVASSYRLPVGVARIGKDGMIERMDEKPEMKLNVGIGILLIKTAVIGQIVSMGPRVDIMGDLLQRLTEGGRVGGFVTNDFWLDLGSLDVYEKLDHGKIDELFSSLIKVPATR
jgi:mannose-1-phosphate guanylyltransferase